MSVLQQRSVYLGRKLPFRSSRRLGQRQLQYVRATEADFTGRKKWRRKSYSEPCCRRDRQRRGAVADESVAGRSKAGNGMGKRAETSERNEKAVSATQRDRRRVRREANHNELDPSRVGSRERLLHTTREPFARQRRNIGRSRRHADCHVATRRRLPTRIQTRRSAPASGLSETDQTVSASGVTASAASRRSVSRRRRRTPSPSSPSRERSLPVRRKRQRGLASAKNKASRSAEVATPRPLCASWRTETQTW